MPQQKRKRVSVTIQQKLDIIEKLEQGEKSKKIAAEYNIGSSTVHDIKKNKEKLLKFSSSMATSLVGIDQRHTMKESPFAILHKAVLQWFNHERTLGHPISGPMIVQRAKELFVTLGLEGSFDGSSGWLCRFKDRYGIRPVGDSLDCVWTRTDLLNQQNLDGETLDANDDSRSEFPPPHLEDEDDLSIVPEKDKDNDISSGNEMEGLGYQNVEDSSSSIYEEEMPRLRKKVSKKATKNKDIGNTNRVVQNEYDENVCVCHNLKSIVQHLQSVSDKLAASSLCDSYDEFSKYISSLLRGLPRKKALNLKKKLVNDIIEVWLAHERGDPDPPSSETTPKRSFNKVFFSKNMVKFNSARQVQPSVSSNPKESTEVDSIPDSISKQPSSLSPFQQPLYQSINITSCASTNVPVVHHPAISTPVTFTECESIRTLSSTANGTLVAVTLPSRGSAVGADRSSSPPVLSASYSSRGRKRKQGSEQCITKRTTTVSQFPVADTSTAATNESSSEFNTMIKEDGTETECDIEDGRELAEMKYDEELMDVHLSTIMVKEEASDEEPSDPLGEENMDADHLFLCDLCLSHCPTKDQLILHFQKEHPGCVPTFKDGSL